MQIHNHYEHTHQCPGVIGWLFWDRASGGAQVMRRKEFDESTPPQEITSFLSALYSFCVSPFLCFVPPHTAPDVINESLRPCTPLFQTTASKQPSLARGANMASKDREELLFLHVKCCVWLNLTSSH